jgi:hypothetical protein
MLLTFVVQVGSSPAVMLELSLSEAATGTGNPLFSCVLNRLENEMLRDSPTKDPLVICEQLLASTLSDIKPAGNDESCYLGNQPAIQRTVTGKLTMQQNVMHVTVRFRVAQTSKALWPIFMLSESSLFEVRWLRYGRTVFDSFVFLDG